MKIPKVKELEKRIKELEKSEQNLKGIEEALRQSENKYKIFSENISLGFFRSTPGPKGKLIEVNSATIKILGYKNKKDLYAKNVADTYKNPEERIKYSEKLSRVGFLKNEELVLRKKSGDFIIVSETAIAVKDSKGEILYFAGIIEDITDRKRIEEKLHVQNTYLERLFNSAPEAIVLHGNDDRILDVNDEFVNIFGYSKDEAIGQPINDLLASKEFEGEAIKISENVIRGEKIDLESKRKRKDGSLIDVSILGAPIIHEGKQIADYAIYRDISERKKAEEARIRFREETRMARDIQQKLLPQFNPSMPGYDIAGKNVPAFNVGGDYFDFIPSDLL